MKISNIKKKNTFLILLYCLVVFFILIKIIQKTPGQKGSLIDEIIILTKQPYLINHVYNSENVDKKYLFNGILQSIYQKFIHRPDYETLFIDMRFENYLKIQSDRKIALNKLKKSQYLSKKTKVNAKIKFNNKEYKSRIRLKGDRADHWGRNKRFSFDIELLGNNEIFKFKRFAISNHKSRSFPQNEIISNSARRLGLITPKFKTVKVIFNGDDWGLMYLEEQFSSNFFEDRKIKQVPIARFTDQENDRIISEISNEQHSNDYFEDLVHLQGRRYIKIFNKSKYKKKLNAKNFISFYKSFNLLTRDFNLNKKEEELILSYYSIEKFATLLAYNSLFNDWHSTNHSNIRYYFNPYAGKIEPIPTDFLGSHYWNNFSRIENLDYIKKKLIGLDKIFINLFNNKYFIENYYHSLNKIYEDIPNMQININKLCKNYSSECYRGINFENLEYNYKLLIKNKKLFRNLKQQYLSEKKNFDYIKIINNKLTSNLENKITKKIQKKIYLRVFSNGEIYIENISPTNLTINNIILSSSINKDRADICKNKILFNRILIPGDKFRDSLKRYNYDYECLAGVNQIDIEINNIFQSYELIIENEEFTKTNFLSIDKENKFSYINSLSFISKEDQNYIFDAGSHVINKPLIIPNGHNLIIQNGTEISFSKDSFIHIIDGDLLSFGKKNKVNKLRALNDTWGGILVSNSSNSIIKNTIFEKINYFNNRKSNIYLTGAINFYKSKVEFENVKFVTSIAEDALNIINSEFLLNNVIFNDSNSDALDLDFSKGTISNFQFSEINGDAIDTSGSKVYINNGIINKIDDKAISIGENSEIKAEEIFISNSLIGIAIKDNSLLNLNKVSFKNNNTDISAYLKKSYYRNGGKAFINNYSPDTILVKKDKFSQLILNNKEFKNINYKYEN